MTNPIQLPASNCAPFVPVLKADAAKVLRVTPRTIDNYISQGLLPKPRQFGNREMWHPDIFYGHLSSALFGVELPDTTVAMDEPPTPTALDVPEVQFDGPATPPSGAPRRRRSLNHRLAEINQRHAA